MSVSSNITNTTSTIDNHGITRWYKNGLQHRDGDLPAVYTVHNNNKWWYKNGQLHRDGLFPAVCHINYTAYWKYGRFYKWHQLIIYYSRLTRFGRYALKKIRLMRLKHKRWIHGELLCKPPRGNYTGGQDYHKMVGYFTKLVIG